ncbi:MAG: hypothetical protein EZS28_002672 [Streblomastix strix]|uniref:Uncharacterized protein n=1 Tax=Streblomastix strix TaxID=222440 RepID=A0A5J4X3L5_9EUKA|nr:MAG: hypothetical protein EZS28_002672 [Streblomastix strix]
MLLIPLELLWQKESSQADRARGQNLLIFCQIGALLSAIGDQFMIHPYNFFAFLGGGIFFTAAHLCYIKAYLPQIDNTNNNRSKIKENDNKNKNNSNKGFFSQISSVIRRRKKSKQVCNIGIIALVPILAILFTGMRQPGDRQKDVSDAVVNVVGLFVYLFVEVVELAVLVSVGQDKTRGACRICHRVGIMGTILFILSDVVLFLHLFYEGLLPLANGTVIVLYYSGQFALAYATRQFSCSHQEETNERKLNGVEDVMHKEDED